MGSLVIHGHFYQPPRENPWTGAIDYEESARPHHDWNERIHAECYRANAFARIADASGRVEQIVNNYRRISFNIGPTLLSWLERCHPQTYARILEADRLSIRDRNGHGNAIAQGYNHSILPLCNARDLRTQIRWGTADFGHRFRRAPEALWIPETACNDETLGALIDARLAYVILSPHQAERVRPLGSETWRSVADGSIDPRAAYRYFHRDGSGRSIAIFFYDDLTARSIAFGGALASSEGLVERLARALGREGALANVATDGESYGHHFHFGDRCLAYALEVLASARGLTVSNYGEVLERCPPRDEVEIKPGPNGEGTSWSCAHGVGRWYRDCGCQTGGREGWHQQWRGPLRQALDLLRDEAAREFDAMGGELMRDPWRARDDYIEVMLERGANRERFHRRHARRRLSESEQARMFTLLETQRHAMLMYTSCGWFFADLAGLEAVQVMKYAGRVVSHMYELGLRPPLEAFLDTLAQARSNLPEMGSGADIYRRLVQPARVNSQRVAAHLAMSMLAGGGGETAAGEFGNYRYSRQSFRREGRAAPTLASGRILLEVPATGKQRDYAFAAMHLGGMDFCCALHPYAGAGRFKHSVEKLWGCFKRASLPTVLRIVREEFGPDEFGLEDIVPDGRRAISELAFAGMLHGFTDQFMRLYEDNRRIVDMLLQAGFELPPALRHVNEFALGRRFELEVCAQNGSRDPAAYRGAIEIAAEVERGGYRIDRSGPNQAMTAMIDRAVHSALANCGAAELRGVIELVELSRAMRLEPNLDSAQEMVYAALAAGRPGSARLSELEDLLGFAPESLKRLLPMPAANENGEAPRTSQSLISDESPPPAEALI